MKTTEMLLIGGAGLAAVYFLSSSSTPTVPGTTATTSVLSNLLSPTPTVAANPASPVIPAAPVSNGLWNNAYYLQYQYPQLQILNPNILNPNHMLTDAEAQAYLNNYLDLQQGLPTWPAQTGANAKYNLEGGNLYDKARSHWGQFGVPQQRSFYPFTPVSTLGYVYPTTTTASKSSGGGIFGDILGVVKVAAPVVAALAGVPAPGITNEGVDAMANGAAIALAILPMYYNASPTLSMNAEEGIKSTLTQYL